MKVRMRSTEAQQCNKNCSHVLAVPTTTKPTTTITKTKKNNKNDKNKNNNNDKTVV